MIFSALAAAAFIAVPPQQVGSVYVFAFPNGGPRLEVAPATGGRLSSLTSSGSEFLYLDKSQPNWGSTLWSAPQSAWNWPPPHATDAAVYTAAVRGDTLVLESPKDGQLGLVFTKRILARDADTCFLQSYGIRNAGTSPIKVAPWQVTRVPPGGLSFFPKGPGGGRGSLASQVKEISGWMWYDMDAAVLPGGVAKYFADGSGGWMAHLDRGGLMLLEAFPDIEASQAAPEEAELEIYADPAKKYEEVEHQGAYVTLAPGESLAWTTRWYLRRIPPAAKKVAGDAALIAFATEVARRASTGIRVSSAGKTPSRRRGGLAWPMFMVPGGTEAAGVDGRIRDRAEENPADGPVRR